MSHIKQHMSEHEAGTCDPATCLVCKQQEMQAKVYQLQGYPPDAELKHDADLNLLYDAARLVHFNDSILHEFAHRWPGQYGLLRAALLNFEAEMMDEEPYVGDDGGTCQDEDGRFAPHHGLDGSGG